MYHKERKKTNITSRDTPTNGSSNPVTSSGVYDALIGKANLKTARASSITDALDSVGVTDTYLVIAFNTLVSDVANFSELIFLCLPLESIHYLSGHIHLTYSISPIYELLCIENHHPVQYLYRKYQNQLLYVIQCTIRMDIFLQ